MIADQMFSVGIAVVVLYAIAVGVALFLGAGKTPRRELGLILANVGKRSSERSKSGGLKPRTQSFGDVVHAFAAARSRAKAAGGCNSPSNRN